MRHRADERAVFLVGLIRDYMTLYGISDSQMAQAVGVCETTWYARKRNPENFSVAELRRVAKRAGIPWETLKERL